MLSNQMSSTVSSGLIRQIQQCLSNNGLKPRLQEVLYEPGAGPSRMAFRNTRLHVETHGGRVRLGWVFQVDYWKTETRALPYLCMLHHAVWQSVEDGCLVDVTPFEEALKPLMTEDGWIVFLSDEMAIPQTVLELALPTRFYALYSDERLQRYIEALNHAEQRDCEQAYQKAGLGLIQLEC